jgi:hypothetical protein
MRKQSGRRGPYRQASPPAGPAPPRRPVCAPAAMWLPRHRTPTRKGHTNQRWGALPVVVADVDAEVNLAGAADAAAPEQREGARPGDRTGRLEGLV